MKHQQYSISDEAKTTFTDVWRWGQELERLHARIALRFARPEPRRRALAYLQGIVSSVERKNGWHLAEHAGESRPDGMQRLLNSATWDADLVRDDLRTYILERLGDPQAILVIDETSFRKRGKKSAGVGQQHCGTTGQLENCQVGVFLSYVSHFGHTLIDRELYIPLRWTLDRERCREAGIPDSVRFQTKCEQARQMIERLWRAQIPFAWVVADTVYGGNGDLRAFLEAHQYFYGLAVACDEPVGIQTTKGRKWMTVAQAEALSFHAQDWQRLSMSDGTKGPRLFEWAVMPMLHQWEDDGQHFLLVRRCLDDPSEKTYYFVFAPLGTTLAEMVKAIGQRWRIEECFETGKEMGLEDYEVRCYQGWYRHVTLVMMVEACLAGICAKARMLTIEPTTDEGTPPTCPLLPLTIPEVRHLLAYLLCVIYSRTCSGHRLVARHWYSPGRGGDVATRAVPASFIPDIVVLQGNVCLAWFHGNPSCVVSHSRDFSGEVPWTFPSISRASVITISQKGVSLMTSLSFIECCHLLAIDPKTLRQWLAQAKMPLHPHPTDARIKCVTSEQIHLLANVHGRVLQLSPERLAPACASPKSDEAQSQVSTPAVPDADLRTRLVQMEAQMVTLQAHLDFLTLQLLQEREQRTEQRLLTLEALLPSTGQDTQAPLARQTSSVLCQPAMPPLVCHPSEKRTRLIPLIEYGARGRYVLICPEKGEVPITPDSPEWFAWLASLSSFRFVDQSGRFSARRGHNHRPNRGWYAQRGIHQKSYSKYIGVSEHVTTDRLEQIAAHFQSYLQ